MVETILITLLMMAALVGWGLVGRQVLLPSSRISWSLAGILGVVAAGFLGLSVHFFWPLSFEVTIAFYVTGILVLILRHKDLLRPTLLELGLTLAAVILLSGYALDNQLIGDSLNYHMGSIKWAKQEPVVFGLANVHDRFGFNSLWLIISALLAFKLENVSYVDFSTIALMIFFLAFLFHERKSLKLLSPIVFACVIFLWGKPLLFNGLGSPGTDMPASLFTILTFLFLILAFREKTYLTMMILCVAMATALKVSQGILLLGVAYGFYVFWKDRSAKTALVKGFIGSAGLGTLWLIRNFITSGCWLFPLAATCRPQVSWALPESITILANKWIRSWARQYPDHPDVILKDWNWIHFWIKNTLMQPYLLTTFILILSLAFIAIFQWKKLSLQKHWLAVWGLGFAGLLFWFLSAPDPRFGSGFWIFLLSLELFFIMTLWPKLLRPMKVLFILLGLVFAQDFLRITFNNFQKFPLKAERFSNDEITPTVTKTSRYGVTYRMPDLVTFKSEHAGCWFAELPCASVENPDLWEGQIFGHRLYETRISN